MKHTAACVLALLALSTSSCRQSAPPAAAAQPAPPAPTAAVSSAAPASRAPAANAAAPAPAAAPATLTPELRRALTSLTDVLPPARDPMKLLPGCFLPIGFSPAGAFAWLSCERDDGRGGLSWRFAVQDLKNDAVRAQVRWLDERAEVKPGHVAAFLAAHGDEVARALSEAQISPAAPARLQPATFVEDGQRYTVSLREKKRRTNQDFPRVTVPYDVVLAAEGKGEKVLGEVAAAEDGDVVFFFPPRVLGVLASPFEDRVAVLVVQEVRGFEGPPNGRKVHVLGGSLVERFGDERAK